MDKEIIITIISSFASIIMLVLGYFFNRKLKKQEKNAKKKEDARVIEDNAREERFKKYISDITEDLVITVTDMKMKLETHIEDTNFKLDFVNTIRNHSRQIITTLTNFLEQEHKNILSHWADTIEKFGLDWYYNSRQKKSKKEIDEYLTQELDIYIKNLDNYVDYTYNVIKIYNNKKVIFSQFLDAVKLHNKTELLKLKLIKNGFKTNQDVFTTFKEYIDDFFNDFTKIITIWNRLEVYEKTSNAA